MPIKRCVNQSFSNQTLVEFYKVIENSNDSISGNVGEHMLKLIEKMNNVFHKSEIYALTSMYNLVLLSDNTWKSEWVLKLITNGVEYIIDESDKETRGLNKRTVYFDESEFYEKIIELMKQSNHWNDVPELQ